MFMGFCIHHQFTLIGINMVDEWKTWLVVDFWTPLCTLSKGSLAQTHYAAIKSTIKCMTQEQKHFCVIKEKLSLHTVSSRKTVLECMRYMKVCITRLDMLFDWWWPGFGCRLPCSYNCDFARCVWIVSQYLFLAANHLYFQNDEYAVSGVFILVIPET